MEPVLPPVDDGTVEATVALLATLDYAALLLAGGLLVFLGHTARGVRLPAPVRRRAARLLEAGAVVAVVAAAVAVPVAAIERQGLPLSRILSAEAFEVGLVTDRVSVLVLHAIGLAAAVAVVRRREAGATEGPSAAPLPLTGMLLTAVAVWSPALVGHTRSSPPTVPVVVTDAVHLSAGAIWLGGVAGLALALPALRGRPREAALLLTRFTDIAAAAVGALAVTGLLLAWRIVGSWAALLDTVYGRLLLIKLALVLVLVATAAHNRFRLLPSLADGGYDQQREAVDRVRRTVAAEIVVLLSVLTVTGLLVDQSPVLASVDAAVTATP